MLCQSQATIDCRCRFSHSDRGHAFHVGHCQTIFNDIGTKCRQRARSSAIRRGCEPVDGAPSPPVLCRGDWWDYNARPFASAHCRHMSQDDIFRKRDTSPGSFVFDEKVAAVFPDMLRRSIPGYETTIEAIAAAAARYVTPGSNCYDLGCSLGAATLAMQRGIRAADCRIIAADSAPAMVERCRKTLALVDSATKVTVVQEDIRHLDIDNASMVVLNYTLQFVPPDDRLTLLKKIHAGMHRDGVLVLSEKVAADDPAIDRLLIELHHDFKRANNYSDLEISRKRTALENVLIPETTQAHLDRLGSAGFRHAGVWMQQFNFLSIIAIA